MLWVFPDRQQLVIPSNSYGNGREWAESLRDEEPDHEPELVGI